MPEASVRSIDADCHFRQALQLAALRNDLRMFMASIRTYLASGRHSSASSKARDHPGKTHGTASIIFTEAAPAISLSGGLLRIWRSRCLIQLSGEDHQSLHKLPLQLLRRKTWTKIQIQQIGG